MSNSPDNHNWTEADFYMLALNLANEATDLVKELGLVTNLSFNKSTGAYDCLYLYENDQYIELSFDLDFGGGTPFPLNIQQYRRSSTSNSELIGGHDQFENFKLAYE